MWYRIVVAHPSRESPSMHQCRLDEQMSPEQYIRSHVHPCPIPFSGHPQWTVEGRPVGDTSCHPSSFLIHIRGVVTIREMCPQFMTTDVAMLRPNDVQVLEVVVLVVSAFDTFELVCSLSQGKRGMKHGYRIAEIGFE